MTKAWAEFLGWQYFENVNGWKPLFRLFVDPPTMHNGTTVTQSTLEEKGVAIPPIPPFKPNTVRKNITMFYCSCSLTFTDKRFIIEHIKDTKDAFDKHGPSMETITLAQLDDVGQSQTSKPIMLNTDEKPVDVVAEATKTAKKTAEDEIKQILKEDPFRQDVNKKKSEEDTNPSDWARSMYEKFNIPMPKRLQQ